LIILTLYFYIAAIITKRLAIIVPYRDRDAHLSALIPHLWAYFQRDKADRNVPYRVIVVE
jgi:N-terminal region of glycosyl transferase group 7